MNHRIDVSSIHLGEGSQYYAQYLPAATTQAECALPSTQDFVLSNVPLEPLNETCQFTFPGITPIPPTYIPAAPPPISCADFTGIVNIVGLNAAKTTKISGTSAGVPTCGFNISGIVDVLACESFKASGKVEFTGAAKKDSTLTLLATSRPDCGVALNGIINVAACETFSSEGTITVKSKEKTRGLSVNTKTAIAVTPASIPACGFKLDGELELDACSSFNLIVDSSGSAATTLSFLKESDNSSLGTFKLTPAVTITGENDCEKTIKFSLGALDTNIIIPDAASTTLEISSTNSSILNRWYLDIAETSTGYSLGMKYDDSKVCTTKATMNEIDVVHIKNPPSCCNGGSSYIDMCAGKLFMQDAEGDALSWDSGTGILNLLKSSGTPILNFSSYTSKAYTELNLGQLSFNDNAGTTAGINLYDGLYSSSADGSSVTMSVDSGFYVKSSDGSYAGVTASDGFYYSALDATSVKLYDAGLFVVYPDSGKITLDKMKLEFYVDGTLNNGYVYLSGDGLKMSKGGDTVDITVPKGEDASFQKINLCIDGETKTAWVLMTDPK